MLLNCKPCVWNSAHKTHLLLQVVVLLSCLRSLGLLLRQLGLEILTVPRLELQLSLSAAQVCGAVCQRCAQRGTLLRLGLQIALKVFTL